MRCSRSQGGVAQGRWSVRGLVAVAGCTLGAASGAALADVAQGGGGLAGLEAAFPGVRSTEWNGRTMMLYGVPMTKGATDGAAASEFVSRYDTAFGVGELELEMRLVDDLQGRPKTVYVYQQMMDGLPVEFGRLTVVTHNGTDVEGNAESTVVMASGKLAARPETGFAADSVSSEQALARVQGVARFSGLGNWSQPEKVVYFGEGDFAPWIESIRAWKFTAESYADPQNPRKYTFFVDAATNELVFARNEILHIDITGQVRGWVSPSNTADHAGNPPVLRDMSEVLVRVQGQPSTTVKADRTGNFVIPWAGSTPVTLEVGTAFAPFGADAVATGQVVLDNVVGAESVWTGVVTPGTPATIIMNPPTGRSEVTTAENNALHYLTLTRNYIADLAPTFAAQMDTIGNSTTPAILPANVMVTGTCNAFYNGVSTNYYPVGGGCNNTAFASVISHEYGHHIVNRRLLAQGAFGEGYSDTVSILMYDDPVIGRFFFQDGGTVRTPDTADVDYPCSGTAVHFCGQILGDFIVELRRALGNVQGSGPGLLTTRQLHADWTILSTGGRGSDSAHPDTIVEFLTADDDDTTFCNGTPNRGAIATAAAQKNLPVPGIEPRLSLALPAVPNPSSADLGQSVTVSVLASDGAATMTPGSGRVLYRHRSSNSFFALPLTQTASNTYSATIPGGTCGQQIEYFFRFGSTQGDVTLPNACTGGTVYSVSITNPNPVVTFFTDTFEGANAGWTGTADAGVTSGQWALGDPNPTAAQPDAGSAGPNCWFTGQGSAGGTVGEADIDGGAVTLTSPSFNLTSRPPNLIMSVDRWFSTGAGATPYTDVFRIEVSGNNGSTWIPAQTLGPANSQDTNPGWFTSTIPLGALGISGGPAGSTQFRARFIAADAGAGSIVEAAVDHFRLASQSCGCNDIDFNNDSSLFDPQDITDFLSVYGEGPCSTGNCDSIDFNNDASLFDPQDIQSFLSVYGEGPCI